MKGKLGNMKVKTKLMLAFTSISIIGLILGITGLASIYRLTAMSGDLNKLQMESNGVKGVVNAHYVWRQNLTETVYSGTEFTGSLDPKACALGLWLDKEGAQITDPRISALLMDISGPHEFIHREAMVLLGYNQAGDTDKAISELFEVILPTAGKVIDGLTQLEELYIELISETTSRIIHAGTLMDVIILAFITLAVIAGVLFSILFPKSMLRPLEILSSSMKKAASGDFTVKLPENQKNEIGQLFDGCSGLIEFSNLSVRSLKTTVVHLQETAQRMLSISTRMEENSARLNEQTASVSTVTEEFSAGMTQSANSLSTASTHISAVASSIEQINSTISTVAAAAEQTSAMVEQSNSLVDSIQTSISKASGSVTAVSASVNSVADSVEEINKSLMNVSEHSVTARNKMSEADEKAKSTSSIIQRLEAASKQIGKIVSLISDIADQTNMLALNAAIEAAGAGEAGKGFMVVANEVKELAKQTTEATDEIAEQIENMQKNMPEAVSAVLEITTIINGMAEFMNSFAREITEQGKRSDQIADESTAAAKRLNEISDEISRISSSALSVTKTVLESTKGVNEIAKSTAELVIGSQEIAMNSERASNNISEINRAATEMTSGVVDISRNIQLINEEAGSFRESADSTKHSSEELYRIAGDLEAFASTFKID